MPFLLQIYLTLWVSACCVALILLRSFSTSSTATMQYRRFLLVPWKVVLFIIAAAGITVIAPYTDDPTWDYYNALGMSILTFSTAPWSIGVLYRTMKRQQPPRLAFVALCAMLFSASWSYDLYLLLKSGQYPQTWFPNLFASSFIYVMAGLLWNLDWKAGRGVIFAFMEQEWPVQPDPAAARRILWFALPIILIVAALFLQFLWPMR